MRHPSSGRHVNIYELRAMHSVFDSFSFENLDEKRRMFFAKEEDQDGDCLRSLRPGAVHAVGMDDPPRTWAMKNSAVVLF